MKTQLTSNPKSYDFFAELINGKHILYIPIISCINRDTNEYNLAADGNVNRFITTFSKVKNYGVLDIILPKKHIEGSEGIVRKICTLNTNLIWAESFGIHAGEQRNNDDVVNGLYSFISTIPFDICIFESQKLGMKFMENYPDKQYIFWNPVSKTKTKTRIFLEGYDEINKQIIDKVDYMIVASPDQIDFYDYCFDKLIYLDKLIDRSLKYFDYQVDNDILKLFTKIYKKKIFYLPFRLTDEGYRFNDVMHYLNTCQEDYIVLYSDPNNSHVIEGLESHIREKFYKVSSNRNTYYTILDYIPCTILYFEDLRFINHAAIHEFMYDKCIAKVLVYNQNENPYNINSCDRIINIPYFVDYDW